MDISNISIDLVTLFSILVIGIGILVKWVRSDKGKEDKLKNLQLDSEKLEDRLSSFCTKDKHPEVVSKLGNLKENVIELYESRNKMNEQIIEIKKDIETIKISLDKQEIITNDMHSTLSDIKVTLGVISTSLKLERV